MIGQVKTVNGVKQIVAISGTTQNFNYSTSEVDTGSTWIDGKKIYQRVLTGTWSSDSTLNVPFSMASNNVERFVDVRLSVDDGNGVVFEYYYASNDYLNCYYASNGNFVLRRGTYPRVPNTYYIVIKYTKTTQS